MESSVEDLSNILQQTKIENDKTEFSDSDLLKIGTGLNLEDTNNLIDKLYIELLNLIEQYIRCKVEMEKRQNEGNLLIAKARYIQGGKTVTIAQLPTDESSEFNALASTLEIDSEETLNKKKTVLEKHSVDKNKGYLDPMKWFGVLVPRCLHFAKERYQLAIDLAVDGKNIQIQLLAVLNYIDQLKTLKTILKNKE